MATPDAPTKSERETTTPFLLRLFFKHGSFHRTDDFSFDTQPRDQLQIYTWPSCTLRELSGLLLNAIPGLFEDNPSGTRIAYRLVYPDPRGAASGGGGGGGGFGGGGGGGGRMRAFDDYDDARRDAPPRTRYLAKDLGSIVCGADGAARAGGAGSDGSEPERSLADARFVIGDWVCAAVLPPLPNGVPAPPPAGIAPRPGGGGAGRRGGRGYENGFGGGGGGGGSRHYERGFGGGPPPMGEWRRGERPPENPGYGRGGYGRGRGRGW